MKISKNQNQKMLDVIEGNEYTYHIVINVRSLEYDEAYELFEKIQNDFSLYDNCVIEDDNVGMDDKADRIIIESTNKKRLHFLAKSIKRKYCLKKVSVRKINKEYTIIDEGRDNETGGLAI